MDDERCCPISKLIVIREVLCRITCCDLRMPVSVEIEIVARMFD